MASKTLSLVVALVLGSTPVAAEQPPSRNGVGVVVTMALVPAFVATFEHTVARETTVWATAGAGSTRSTPAFSADVRRVVAIGGAGARHYLNEFFFLHGDLTYVHVSGPRNEAVHTASSWSKREHRLAALFLPGMSAGVGFGANGNLGPVFGELSFVVRWVFAGRRSSYDQPNVNEAGTLAIIPGVTVGYRF